MNSSDKSREHEIVWWTVLMSLNCTLSFGFSKQFVSEYEIGEEVGWGQFGYTCYVIVKNVGLKGHKVIVRLHIELPTMSDCWST